MIKGIEKIPSLTDEGKEFLKTSELQYMRFGRIYFEVLRYKDNELVVKTGQLKNEAGKYLSTAELVNRAKDVFGKVVPDGTVIHVHPTTFEKHEFKTYSVENITDEMESLGLKIKDLVKLLDIDKTTITSVLSGAKPLTNPYKAMFYYLFKYLGTEKNAQTSAMK